MPRVPDEPLRARIAAARAPSLAWAREWRSGPAVAELAERFAGVATLEAGEAAARALLGEVGWLDRLVSPMVRALRDDPLFEPPVKASRDALRTGMVLFEDAAAVVTASVLDAGAPAMRRLPPQLVVPGRVSHTRYLRGGGAWLHRWQADLPGRDWRAETAPPIVAQGRIALHDGDVVRHDGRQDAILVTGATSDVVSVTVTLRIGAAAWMREYDRAAGTLLRTATLDEGAARTGMLLTLLRESGRADAGECFDAASRDPAFFLRWDAMCEWLALDAGAAWPRLVEMADDPHPEVRAAAKATLALVAARREAAACRD